MLRFSQRLRDLLAAEGWSQVHLARRCGVNAGNVSRWTSGAALPDGEALGKLISKISRQQGAQLLTAWVWDFLPPGSDDLIAVREIDPLTVIDEEPGDVWPADLSKAGRAKFIAFAHLAMRNPHVMEIVDVLHSSVTRMMEKPTPKSRRKR